MRAIRIWYRFLVSPERINNINQGAIKGRFYLRTPGAQERLMIHYDSADRWQSPKGYMSPEPVGYV